MKHIILIFSVACLFVSGCNRPGSDAAISELQKTTAELSSQLAVTNTRLETFQSEIDRLSAEMDSFTQSYDSEMRTELVANIESVKQLLAELRSNAESATDSLKAVQALEAESELLKDQCIQHAQESGDANQIGQVKESLAKLEQSVDKLKRSIGSSPNIETIIRRLETKIRQLESRVRRAP